MSKQETIKHLTALMATIQMAHFKGRGLGVEVQESGEASISIDLYDGDNGGKPVCDGLTFHDEEHGDVDLTAYDVVYDPDEKRPLWIMANPADGANDIDLMPEDVPEEVLTAITKWLKQEMTPDPSPKGEGSNDVTKAKDIINLWSDWCMDWDDENLWLDYIVKHPKGHCNRQHLQEKWDYCYEKYGNKAAMTMFWRELDNDNRTILTGYITTRWHKN